MTCRLLPGEIFVKQDVLYLAFPIPGKWIEIFAVSTFTRLNLSQFTILDPKSAALFRPHAWYSVVIMISQTVASP